MSTDSQVLDRDEPRDVESRPETSRKGGKRFVSETKQPSPVTQREKDPATPAVPADPLDIAEVLWQLNCGCHSKLDEALVQKALGRIHRVAGHDWGLCKPFRAGVGSKLSVSVADDAHQKKGAITSKPGAEDRIAALAMFCRDAAPGVLGARWRPQDTVNVIEWTLSLLDMNCAAADHRKDEHPRRQGAFERACLNLAVILSAAARAPGCRVLSGETGSVDTKPSGGDAFASLAHISAVVSRSDCASEVVVSLHFAAAMTVLKEKSPSDMIADIEQAAANRSIVGDCATATSRLNHSAAELYTPLRSPPSRPVSVPAASSDVAQPWLRIIDVVPYLRIRVSLELLNHFFGAGRGDDMPVHVVDFLAQCAATIHSVPSEISAAPVAQASSMSSLRLMTASSSQRGVGAPPTRPFQGSFSFIAATVVELTATRWHRLCGDELDTPFAIAIASAASFIGVVPTAMWDITSNANALAIASFLSGLWTMAKTMPDKRLSQRISQQLRAFDGDFGPLALIKSLIRRRADPSAAEINPFCIAVIVSASIAGSPFDDFINPLLLEGGTDDDATSHADSTASRILTPPEFATPARRSGFSASRFRSIVSPRLRDSRRLANLLIAIFKKNDASVAPETTQMLLAAASSMRPEEALMVSSLYSSVATRGFAAGAGLSLLDDKRCVSALQVALSAISPGGELYAAVMQRAVDAICSIGSCSSVAQDVRSTANVTVGLQMQNSPVYWLSGADPILLAAALIDSDSMGREELGKHIANSVVPLLANNRTAWLRHTALDWLQTFYTVWPVEALHELLPLCVLGFESLLWGSSVHWAPSSLYDAAAACFEVIDAVPDDKMSHEWVSITLSAALQCDTAASGIAWCAWRGSVHAANTRPFVAVEAASLVVRFEESRVSAVRNAMAAVLIRHGADGASHRQECAMLCEAACVTSVSVSSAAACMVIQKAVDIGLRFPTLYLEAIRLSTASQGRPHAEHLAHATLSLISNPAVLDKAIDTNALMPVGDGHQPSDLSHLCSAILTFRASVSAVFALVQVALRPLAAIGSLLNGPQAASIRTSMHRIVDEFLADVIAASSKETVERRHRRAAVGATSVHATKCPRSGLAFSIIHESTGLCEAVAASVLLVVADDPDKPSTRAAITGATLLLESCVELLNVTLSVGEKGTFKVVLSKPVLRDAAIGLMAAVLGLGHALRATKKNAKWLQFVEAGDAPLTLVGDQVGILISRAALSSSRLLLADFDAAASATSTTNLFICIDEILTGLEHAMRSDQRADVQHESNASTANRHALLSTILGEAAMELWLTPTFLDLVIICATHHSSLEAPQPLPLATDEHISNASAVVAEVPMGHTVDWTTIALRATEALQSFSARHDKSTQHHLEHHAVKIVDRIVTFVCCLLYGGHIGVDRWRIRGLPALLDHLECELRPTAAAHSNGLVTRLPWHHFHVARLKILCASLRSAVVFADDLQSIRALADDLGRKIWSNPRIRAVVESPVTGPVPPPPTHRDAIPAVKAAGTPTPWDIEEGTIVTDLLATLTVSTYSPMCDELCCSFAASAQLGLRDVQERRSEALHVALAPFFDTVTKTPRPSKRRRKDETLPKPVLSNSSSSGGDSSDSDEIDASSPEESQCGMLLAQRNVASTRLSLLEMLSACLPYTAVISPSPATTTCTEQLPTTTHREPRVTMRERHVTPYTLLDIVRNCFHVCAASNRRCSRTQQASDDQPTEKAAAEPTSLSETNVLATAARSFELALIIFEYDCHRWVGAAPSNSLCEFREVATQLLSLMQRAPRTAPQLSPHVEMAYRRLAEVSQLLGRHLTTTAQN